MKKYEDNQYPVLDYDTQKHEKEIGNEDLFAARDKIVKKTAKWNTGLSSGCKASRALGRRNDLKNNDTWISVAKMKRNTK